MTVRINRLTAWVLATLAFLLFLYWVNQDISNRPSQRRLATDAEQRCREIGKTPTWEQRGSVRIMRCK